MPFTCADSVIIPTQPEYLSATGTQQLLSRIQKTKNDQNPQLEVEGILITMTDERTLLGKKSTDRFMRIMETFSCIHK